MVVISVERVYLLETKEAILHCKCRPDDSVIEKKGILQVKNGECRDRSGNYHIATIFV
jgi:hypothetical protein